MPAKRRGTPAKLPGLRCAAHTNCRGNAKGAKAEQAKHISNLFPPQSASDENASKKI
jgi:hypothetical protein